MICGAREAESGVKTIILLIGPEGGFSHEEVEMAVEADSPRSLGSHILRTETAPIVACPYCSMSLGRWGQLKATG